MHIGALCDDLLAIYDPVVDEEDGRHSVVKPATKALLFVDFL